MDQRQVFRQMLQYNKSISEACFTNLGLLHEHMENNAQMMLDQTAWIPGEGRKVMEEWAKACKQGRQNLKNAVDEGFKRVEAFYSDMKNV